MRPTNKAPILFVCSSLFPAQKIAKGEQVAAFPERSSLVSSSPPPDEASGQDRLFTQRPPSCLRIKEEKKRHKYTSSKKKGTKRKQRQRTNTTNCGESLRQSSGVFCLAVDRLRVHAVVPSGSSVAVFAGRGYVVLRT